MPLAGCKARPHGLDPACCSQEHTRVWLPLQKLDECAVCGAKSGLRLCSSCGERIYCSIPCQKTDWSSHKLRCGKTAKLELTSFYPFLAVLVEQCHVHCEKPRHIAMSRQILNSIEDGIPAALAVPGFDGSARVLMVGSKRIAEKDLGSEAWWPGGHDLASRAKLLRRVMRTGNVLASLTAVCIAVLAELYATSSGALLPCGCPNPQPEEVRRRLRYKSSPIADFGIVNGAATARSCDKLAFYDTVTKTLTHGQDPEDHYWIYFRTIRGEEVSLDCAMFAFGMGMVIDTEPYVPPHIHDHMSHVPAFFQDRLMTKNTPGVHASERRRVSALHNPLLQRAVLHSKQGFDSADMMLIGGFMESVAGRKIPDSDVQFTGIFAGLHCGLMGFAFEDDRWKSWPPKPKLAVEQEQWEREIFESLELPKSMPEEMMALNRMLKRGEISRDQFNAAWAEYTTSIRKKDAKPGIFVPK